MIAHSRINPKHQCPGPTWPWPRYLDMVTRLWTPSAAHAPGVGKTTLRLFDPASNTQVGTVSLIDGTDKVYLVRKDG